MTSELSKGYCPIEDYGLIGDMHTCALVSKSGSIDFMCWPVFDSPSIFCRLLDKYKGGYFAIHPAAETNALCKQKYAPYTNLLDTKWVREDGVVNVLDFFPVDESRTVSRGEEGILSGKCPCRHPGIGTSDLLGFHSGVVRRVACVSGSMDMAVELFPAFNYARDDHWIVINPENEINGSGTQTIMFESRTQRLIVDVHLERSGGQQGFPAIRFKEQNGPGPNQKGIVATFKICMDQTVNFVIHSDQTRLPQDDLGPYFAGLQKQTLDFWTNWARKCTFRGHYREQVERSLLTLKLLTYKPTGAIVASPTFSLPEAIGGARNWDYRYSWIRDTSFALYVFLENGYSEEAEAYMSFVYDHAIPSVSRSTRQASTPQGLPIVLTIRGEAEIPEFELDHFEGYRGSRPVRIGNGATSHVQLDSFGALLDSIYLYNKFAGPISYDRWVEVRRIINHIIPLRHEPDMSIWEVRGEKQNFVYSKVMLWVAVDRALRLSDKRSNLPCPDRLEWLSVHDELYEEIMEKGYNSQGGFFSMSYENPNVLDASLLMVSLVLFAAPDDPRVLSTLNHIMRSPENGGLTSASMVFRYDHRKVKDGIGGDEGKFIMVTFWLIEALSRASRAKVHMKDHPQLLELRTKAFAYFDNALSFSNHLGIFSEEVSASGELSGNMPQAFSHLACVSAAMNLARGHE